MTICSSNEFYNSTENSCNLIENIISITLIETTEINTFKFEIKEESITNQEIVDYFYANPSNFITFSIDGLSMSNDYSYKIALTDNN